ncbi:cytochrome P450 [Microdochium trichocladiopsis]|uniref:Cytochrome P450 n=1 Tax=Microdochium trichocladiopsis TaxID=1682393 RepID=A0A9P8XPQ7_9PEZI|nr:cytochrome P450 [Microdochium trichocladiopsis]KAH7009291.1 cytochrome P450 [Microdochium trichocladiopsis]
MDAINVNVAGIGAGLFAATYTAYHVYVGLTGPLASLPGPTWSKFTGLPVVYHIHRGTRMYFLHDLHKRYGPIVRVTPNEVSISDPKAAKEIHKFRSEYLKTQFYEDASFDEAQNVFTTADPVYHAEWRKLFAKSVSQSNLITFQPLIQKYVDILIRQRERERREQGYVDLVKWFKSFTSDVTGELSVGSSLGMLETGEGDWSKTRHLPCFPFSTLRGVSTRLNSVAKAYIDDYRARVAAGGAGSTTTTILLDRALETQAREKGSISEHEILSNAVILMLAGTDTTANTLAYMLWLLFKFPDIKAQLDEEIDEARLPGKPGIEDLAKLKYLDYFMLEVMRLYGAAPGPLQRKVPKGGRDICGYFVPAGMTVSPLGFSISRDPVVYPEPDTFNPDRWADATTAMKEADFSFGGGTRICLGMHIANLEMKMVVVAFLRSSLSDAQLAYGINGASDNWPTENFPGGRVAFLLSHNNLMWC